MSYENKLAIPISEVPRFVEKTYGRIVRVSDIRYGYMSSTLKLESEIGNFLLKAYPESVCGRLEYGISLNNRLASKGIPVPMCIPSISGEYSNCKGKNQFVLWQFIEGVQYTPGNLKQLAEAGSTLARIHAIGKGIVESDIQPDVSFLDSLKEELDQVWCVLDLKGVGLVKYIVQDFRNRMERIGDEIPKSGLDLTVIHGDFRAQNLLFDGNQLVAVLDLDAAQTAPQLFDVSYALMFFQAVIVKNPLKEFEVAEFLQAYCAISGIRIQDHLYFPALLEVSLLKGITLWMRISVEIANSKAPDWIDAYLPLLKWVDRIRQDFPKQFS